MRSPCFLAYFEATSAFPLEYHRQNRQPFYWAFITPAIWLSPLLFSASPLSKCLKIYIKWHFWGSIPVVKDLDSLSCSWAKGRIRSQEVSDEIFHLITGLILSFFRILWKAVDPICNSDSVGVNERVCKECEGVKYAANHPYIHFAADLELQIGVDHFRRAVHRRGNSLHLLSNMAVFWFVNPREVDNAAGARTKVTEFEAVVLTNYYILYLYVLVVQSCLVDHS